MKANTLNIDIGNSKDRTIVWPMVKLGDVASLVNGRAYKKDELLSVGKYRVLRVGNFFTNEKWYWSDLELEENKYCSEGDLLYAWSASFGPRIWSREKSIFHYHIWKVDFDRKYIVRDWLKYWFEWDVDQIKSTSGVGTTMLHVTKGVMESRELRVPPLDEQKRIVAKLDHALGVVEEFKANTAQAKSQLDALWQSALTQSFSGDWPTFRLGDVVEFRPAKKEVRATVLPDSLVSFLPMEDLGLFQKYVVPRLSRPFNEVERQYTFFAENDLLIAKITPCFENGKMGIAQGLESGFGFGSSEYIVARASERTCSDYLFYLLSKKSLRKQLADRMTGSVGHKRVKQDLIAELQISIPPLDEQKRIVAKLDLIKSELDRQREILVSKELETERLRSSILTAAFSGEL